jgi:pyruvate,orthophosphate dikinase
LARAVFSAAEAEEWESRGEQVILVRIETSPDDIRGMNAAQGILTSRGGMTSHAAVVARGMGKPCVAGCSALQISYAEDRFKVGDKVVEKGDWISIDGAKGEVFIGQVKTVPPLTGDFGTFMAWVDEFRTMGVRTNADTPHDASVARSFGAQGIGLCRTEHMFFEGDRIDAVREMITARDLRGRREALAKLLPMQRDDFVGIFRAMDGFPVTIRTLDPPLHEFLPHRDDEIEELSYKINVNPERLKETVEALAEANPMLGHRGCRLGMVYPEITEMQARAILEAACIVAREGVSVLPEIMIPLVATVEELKRQRKVVIETARKVFREQGLKVDYLVGTMIELPRAALVADKIAAEAEFFSFGTNDLTQTTFGLSRDDAGKFLPFYVKEGILPADPFVSIDEEGVGALVAMGVKLGRKKRRKLKVGICGEHGGDPASVAFCYKTGLNYVSCSPFRVPIARLAAAQAAIGDEG